MKRIIKTILPLLMILTLAGCGQNGSGARQSDNGNSVEKAINAQIEAAETEDSATEAPVSTVEPETAAPVSTVEPETAPREDDAKPTDSKTVDYDLTAMNSDMVYATVFQMMMDPEAYVGKTVKMKGPFYPYTNAEGTVYYPACVIEDALACCAQGMEFVLTGASYPDGYPEMGTVITVLGTFETYLEDGLLYCHLADATLEA